MSSLNTRLSPAVPQGPDQCDEAARLGTTHCRRVLDHLRPVEAGVGAWRPGACQSGLLTRTIGYRHQPPPPWLPRLSPVSTQFITH